MDPTATSPEDPASLAACEVCGEPVQVASSLQCSRCAAPYHVDCWHFVGRCSIFGCECTEPAAHGAVVHVDPGGLVHIDEATRPPVQLRARAEGLVRRVRAGAVYIPRTAAASFGGAVLAFGVMHGFISMAGHHFVPGALEQSAPRMLLLGASYGVLAPYLAPSQHRDPAKVALGAMGLWAVFLVFSRVVPWWLGYDSLSPFMDGVRLLTFFGCVLSAILAASSASERLLGARTEVSERLGWAALPARVFLSWALTWILILPLHSVWWAVGYLQHPVQLLEVGVWSLLAVGSGVTALETGKTEYRKSLMAAEGELRRLPGS